MKYLIFTAIIISCVFLLFALSFPGSNDATTSALKGTKSDNALKTQRVYPIAPGVWYPGQGPLPEKPIRYYRVRCWPGCHRGSDYGKYPDKPLNMEPIHQTSALRAQKGENRPQR
ncbi:MAG: hypothetical protein JRJ29_11930 [Deltaproteobacteria bacterium]|nr:hypothetical protein [Deltaproteobacteria bacterium]